MNFALTRCLIALRCQCWGQEASTERVTWLWLLSQPIWTWYILAWKRRLLFQHCTAVYHVWIDVVSHHCTAVCHAWLRQTPKEMVWSLSFEKSIKHETTRPLCTRVTIVVSSNVNVIVQKQHGKLLGPLWIHIKAKKPQQNAVDVVWVVRDWTNKFEHDIRNTGHTSSKRVFEQKETARHQSDFTTVSSVVEWCVGWGKIFYNFSSDTDHIKLPLDCAHLISKWVEGVGNPWKGMTHGLLLQSGT